MTMKKILYAILILLSATSCNDIDFLTEKPKYFYTIDNAFSTQDQVDQALATCYSRIRDLHSMNTEGLNTVIYRCQNGTDMFDVPAMRKNWLFTDYSIINPEHPVFMYVFSFWYKMIASANLALYGADLKEIAWDSEQSRRYAAAQAHFFRAWAYKNLGECFGGVFIVPELCFTPKFDFERVSRVETYQYAISELECCLDDFPTTHTQSTRIVKAAALHTLAALYLDLGIAFDEEKNAAEAAAAYRKSVEYATDLIDGGTHSLMVSRFGKRMFEGPKYYYANNGKDKSEEHTYEKAGVVMDGNVYWDLFQPGNVAYNSGNKEAIWTIHCDFDACMDEDKASKLNYSRSFSPVIRDVLPGVLDGSQEDVGGRGVAWIMPTGYTRDIVYQGKWGEGDLRNSEAVLRRTFLGNNPSNTYYGKVVPWKVLYREGQNLDTRNNAYGIAFPISCKVASDVYPDDSYGGNKSYLFRDDYIIRLSETYINRAEAHMRLGEYNEAAADINTVRSRAQCTYLVSSSDVNVDLILDERARELVYEEYRWNTLLRMGGTVATDRIRKYAFWDAPRSGSLKNFSVWPIPQTVIDTNIDVKIEQNEGWY